MFGAYVPTNTSSQKITALNATELPSLSILSDERGRRAQSMIGRRKSVAVA